jgi:hypothetical protein
MKYCGCIYSSFLWYSFQQNSAPSMSQDASRLVYLQFYTLARLIFTKLTPTGRDRAELPRGESPPAGIKNKGLVFY